MEPPRQAVPRAGALRAVLATACSLAVIAIALVVTLIAVLIVAFASMPAGCGFNASDACTNPNANEVSALVVVCIVLLVVAGSTVGLVTVVVGAVLGRAGRALRTRTLAALSALLVLAVGGGSIGILLVSASARPVLAGAVIATIAGWPIALLRAQHAAAARSDGVTTPA